MIVTRESHNEKLTNEETTMSYLPKALVEKSIKKRVRRDKQGRERVSFEAYFGTDPFTKFAVRKTRSSEEELKRDIKDFFLRHQSGGDAAVRLTPIEARKTPLTRSRRPESIFPLPRPSERFWAVLLASPAV